MALKRLPRVDNRLEKVTPRRAAVGLALEPESSRWRLQEALRLSVERTCTPASRCNLRVCAYRLRDITNWRTLQGAASSIPQSAGAQSAALLIGIPGQGTIDPIKQAAQLIAAGTGLLIKVLLFV
jgi:hypothetical protein